MKIGPLIITLNSLWTVVRTVWPFALLPLACNQGLSIAPKYAMYWGRRLSLFWAALFCVYTPLLKADFSYAGKTFRDSVDLSNLHPETKIQHGGSCHVHSAASLFEAACYKETGQRIKLSEAYLFYRHLRQTVARRGINPTRRIAPGDGYTEHDGGFEEHTLERILASHSVLVEEDANDEAFFQFLEAWVKKEQDDPDAAGRGIDPLTMALWAVTGASMGGVSTMALAPKCDRAFISLAMGAAGGLAGLTGEILSEAVEENDLNKKAGERFAVGSDKAANEAFGLQGDSPSEGRWGLSDNAALREGLQRRWRIQQYVGTTENLLTALNNGDPFICADTFDFGNVRGPHAALVLGYRFQGSEMQLLIHNANGKAAQWWSASSCQKITLLTSE